MKIKKQYEKSFTIIDNAVLNNTNLSWKAKGLFVYLWSQADEWDYYETEIVKHSTDGLSSLKSGIKELEEQGYLRRERKRDGKGYFKENEWLLSDYPMCENRMLDNRPLTNTNNNNTNNNNNSFTQDSINTKEYDTTNNRAESIGKIKNRGNNTEDKDNTKDNNKKSNDNKDKENNSNIDNTCSIENNCNIENNCSIDNKCSIDNTCSIEDDCSKDEKESKGRGSSVNTKKDDTCNIENECSIEEKKEKHRGSSINTKKDDACNIDYTRFIEWFNKETGKRFRNTESNRKLVRARLNEGYTKEDIVRVVKLKAEQWKDDKQMNKYLRFTTLFAPSHFDNYLQEAIAKGETLEPQKKKKRESSAKEKTEKANPVEEKIYQYKLFLREHPDNKVIKEALEQLEQNKE